jgi:glycosyltransferase involved in cell wall biosynthesis
MSRTHPPVFQYVSDLHQGDAVGDSARLLDGVLTAAGIPSQLLCLRADPGVRGRFRCLENPPRPPDQSDQAIHILHLTLPSPLTTLFPTLPGRRVLIHHNITPAEHLWETDPELADTVRIGRAELGRLARAAHLGLGDSEFNRRELEEAGCPRTGVLPILLDWSRYDCAPSRPLARALGRDLYNILFVGRIAPNKRQDQLIRAFYLLHSDVEPRTRLILVGKPDRHRRYRDALLALIKKKRVDGVILAGHVPFTDLVTYYRAADLFVCLSEHEGFCVPLLEAFRFDVPVVAYAAGAVPDTLGGAGVLLRRQDPLLLAELMGILLHDTALRQRLVSGQRRRLKDFAFRTVAQRFLAALAELR